MLRTIRRLIVDCAFNQQPFFVARYFLFPTFVYIMSKVSRDNFSRRHETSLIIIHGPGMRPGPESNRGPLD